MRIGILTLTPNTNYGGILQAYALKKVLEDMGNDVQIINRPRMYSVKDKIIFFCRALYKKFYKKEFVRYTHETYNYYRSQNTRQFIDKYLNFTNPINTTKQFRNYVNQNFDTLVIGSDQVWRPIFKQNIFECYADGISENIKKIAYSVSFGVDEWEYTPSQTSKCRNLVKKFKMVSVRESSGVELAKRHLDCSAHFTLDPTMLLPKECYLKLLPTLNGPRYENNGSIFTYILNPTKEKTEIINLTSTILGLNVDSFNTNAENPAKPLNEGVAPPVEKWIEGINNADFIITDSFHGCVFSIIFNKPFFVCSNSERGNARFHSLLETFGLTDRMIVSASQLNTEMIHKPIDWEAVNAKKEHLKTLSLDILTKSIIQ